MFDSALGCFGTNVGSQGVAACADTPDSSEQPLREFLKLNWTFVFYKQTSEMLQEV